MVKSFDDIRDSIKSYVDSNLNSNQKIGAEIAVEKITDRELFEQLSFLDAQDKAIALKIMAIKSILAYPPEFLEDSDKKEFTNLSIKCKTILSDFMTICKSTDGKTLNTLRDIFSSGMTINDNSHTEDKYLKLK